MVYQRGFSTQRRGIVSQPVQGRVQINRFGVDKAFHGITMPQPHFLNPVNFHCCAAHTLCGAAHTLIGFRPWFQEKVVTFSNLNKQGLTPKWHFWARPEGLGPNCPVIRQKSSVMIGIAFGFFPVTEHFGRRPTLFLFMSA